MKKLLIIATPLAVIIFILFSFSKNDAHRSRKFTAKNKVIINLDTSSTQNMVSKLRLLEDKINAYFEQGISNKDLVGAAVAIVKCDSIIYTGGFGERTSQSKDSINSNTIFRIGSLSKGFAGILTGIHVQEGLLDWGDKIKDYVPNFEMSNTQLTNEVTLCHVLSHTTGLPYHSFTNLVEAGIPLNQIAGRFKEVSPVYDPGKIYSYQNAVFALSGKIIEQVTSHALKEVIHEKIFDPLHMDTASASFEALEDADNIAIPHQKYHGRWKPVKLNHKYYQAISAGGVNASVTDMAKWMKFLLGSNPEVLHPNMIDQVFNPVIEVGGRSKYYQRWKGHLKSYYALGWRVHTFKNEDSKNPRIMVHHGGSVNNYRSEIAVFPEEDLGICILFNSPTSYAKEAIPKINEIYVEVMSN
ncbi:serine hydrolase domain-containing protein [Aquimarina sp. W85]|uniref:serine hydrolase domain-containing protein n=1 Tax=Aquimarina rhodophyticola TaxID=3342246 RepID=UPI00366F1F23